MSINLPLSNSTEVAIIDGEDRDLLEHPWHIDTGGYIRSNSASSNMLPGRRLHQVILARMLGATLGVIEPDHRNGNRLDNRRSNLRPATRAQNTQNTRGDAYSFSKYKGVTLDKRTNRWRAKASSGRKYVQLGMFATEREAAEAYDTWARQNHGEFACCNFPAGDERSAAIAGRRERGLSQGRWR